MKFSNTSMSLIFYHSLIFLNEIDHAWGGNYMMFGGAVKGGKILGEYPRSFDPNEEWMLGRGRVIPTTPWDAVFKGIARWAGVPVHKQHDVCPNLINFGSFKFEDNDMFYFGPGSSCSTNQDCDDNNDLGTTDICDRGTCKNKPIPGVCGNGICEPSSGESCSSCLKDCFAPFYCNKLGQDGDFEGEESSSGVRGVLFDIEATRGLSISGIDARVSDDNAVGAKVYFNVQPTNQGTRRLQENLSEYIKVFDSSSIPVNDDGTVSLSFPDMAVDLQKGYSATVYVTLDQSGRLMYQSDFEEGAIAKRNEDLKIFAGKTTGSDINDVGSSTDLKTLVGTLNYDYINLEDATMSPTKSPSATLSPTQAPKTPPPTQAPKTPSPTQAPEAPSSVPPPGPLPDGSGGGGK